MSHRKRSGSRALWLVLWLAVCGCKASAPAHDAGASQPSGHDDAAAADAGDAAMPFMSPLPRDASVPARDAGRLADAGRSSNDAGKASAATPTRSTSAPSSCQNGLRDGTESDIDCGGGQCGSCLSGRHCAVGSDCASGSCQASSCTCLPLSACPKDACGAINNCGSELDCGTCTSGVCYENHCCMPRACASDECGVFADGCGGTLRCGDQSCCTPRTCDHPSLAGRCGSFDDRCGGNLSCSCSDRAASCYLGECCKPSACDGDSCGIASSNGCGGTMKCDCSNGKSCYRGHCCKPKDCSDFHGSGCMELDDGCGSKLTCGCNASESCVNQLCCTRTTCGLTQGSACGNTINQDCGTPEVCGCTSGLSCYQAQCCTPKNCLQQELDNRCGPATDGCGVSGLWCGCGQQNGMRVERRINCGHACTDTLAKVSSCDASAALEVLNQTAGWDFASSLSSDPCSNGFGFSPSFSGCSGTGFAVDARGFILLDAGTHCFSITGSKNNSCGALYFVSAPESFTGWDSLPSSTAAAVVSKQTAACFVLTKTDYYPIRWLYTQDGSLESFHVNYCAGSTSNCVPLQSTMLYPSLQ